MSSDRAQAGGLPDFDDRLLGGRPRELRRAAGLNGRQLAGRLARPASKVSELEIGRQTPGEAGIR